MNSVTFKMFFDRETVVKRVKDGTKSRLSKFGSFVRQSARSLLGRRKRSSTAGNPPTSHTRLLKDFIFFGYDTLINGVVVGAMKLNQVVRQSVPAPQLLEQGGTVKRDGKAIFYSKFPFMKPALDINVPNFADQFDGCVSD